MLDNNISIKPNTQVNDSNLNKSKLKTEQVLPFDVIDPTKVTKAAKQEQTNQTGNNLLSYNPDSVFEKFVKSMQSSPVLAEGARKLLLNKQFINTNIKSDPVLSTLFESFLKNIEMDDAEILNFLKFQQGTYTKFHGEFFDTLRNLTLRFPNDTDFNVAVRNFLKSYDCFVSVENTGKSIESALKSIERNLPDVLKQPFNELTEKLVLTNTKGLDLNLRILKDEILPFMGRYISKMNDFGPVRDYVSVLIHNMSRLEAATKDNFSNSLENLFEYIKYNFDINNDDMEKIKQSLVSTYEESASNKNSAMDSFLKLLDSGVKKSENLVNKGLMEEMAESILFSQNVHIPLTHMFLPLNYNGMFMFSELWIGKEYEESSDKKKSDYVPVHKIFLTFDIQNLGYFETTLILKEQNLALDIYVPSNISNNIEKIKNDISTLLSNHNLKLTNLSVRECVKKRRFNEVFNNLAERKKGVDVTI